MIALTHADPDGVLDISQFMPASKIKGANAGRNPLAATLRQTLATNFSQKVVKESGLTDGQYSYTADAFLPLLTKGIIDLEKSFQQRRK